LLETIFLVLTYVAAVGFLVRGLGDLFFDSQFILYLWRNRRKPRVSLQQLRLVPEQWIALFVPAWQEGGIVNKMAEYAARVISYEKYDLFIGVYPNDPETNRCVDEVCAANPRLHKVSVPHPGPAKPTA
jgi:adsorption protein B